MQKLEVADEYARVKEMAAKEGFIAEAPQEALRECEGVRPDATAQPY